MKQRGELTTQQLVTLIILIVSFGIILFLIFGLDLGEKTDKEICHNSVILKGRSVLKSGSLDCKTNYVCISGGGKCKDISPTITVEIDMNPEADNEKERNEKIKNQTMKAIAEEMADCWWMFGEGKIDYVGRAIVEDEKVCALCSRISFDKTIQDFIRMDGENKINYKDFYNYLQSTDKKKGVKYLNYLHNTNKLDGFKLPDEAIDFTTQYIVFTGMVKEGIASGIFYAPYNFVKSFFVDDKKKEKIESFPASIQKKENIGDLKCIEFITKA